MPTLQSPGATMTKLPSPTSQPSEPSVSRSPIPIRTRPTSPLHPATALPRRSRALIPSIIEQDGPRASSRFLEFFAAQIRNPNTRTAYHRAAARFFDWSEHTAGINHLASIEPIHVAAWIEHRTAQVSAPTVKQELAALRKLFDWLALGRVLQSNPASIVRGPSHSVTTGSTPILTANQARLLLSSIPPASIAGQRDRTLIALMIYSFARISAALSLNVGDIYREQHRLNLRLAEKGGKRHVMPCHHTLDHYLVRYMERAQLGPSADVPLFQTITRDRRTLTGRRLNRTEAWYMVRRRARAAAIDTPISCHTFRGTGITAYLQHPDAKLEEAQKMAAHSDPKTTRLYDRRSQAVTIDDVERICI